MVFLFTLTLWVPKMITGCMAGGYRDWKPTQRWENFEFSFHSASVEGSIPHRRFPWWRWDIEKWWLQKMFGISFCIWKNRNFCDMAEISATHIFDVVEISVISQKFLFFHIQNKILNIFWYLTSIMDIFFAPLQLRVQCSFTFQIRIISTRILSWGGVVPIEEVHDGGKISKNDDYKRCLEFYSGYIYGKIEISAIWQKFRRCRNFRSQKFLPYSRNFYFPKSRIKFQTSFAIIIFRYLTSIMDIFYGAPHPLASRAMHRHLSFSHHIMLSRKITVHAVEVGLSMSTK